MKNKILLFLILCSSISFAQVSTGQEQEFDYGIKNNSAQTVSDPVFVTTQGADGTYGKITAKNLLAIKSSLSTGLIKNGAITINADPTKFNVTAGIGIISNFDDPENPISTIVNFPAFNGVTPTYLTTGNITYIAINSTPAIVMQATPFTAIQRRDLIELGAVIHSNLTTINTINNISSPSNDVGNSVADLFNFLGARNQEGNVYSANGANLQLNKSAGVILKYGANFHLNAKNPHNVFLPEQLSLTFRYRLQGGFEGTDRINVDVDNYDLNNVLTAVPPNKYTIQTIFIPQTGQTRIQYGQTTYNTLADAVASINTRKFVTETNLASQFVKVAYLVVKKGATSLQVVADADIIQASKFDATASGGVAITYQSIIDALTYVPEDVVNKVTSLASPNNTTYPTTQLMKDQLDLKQNYPQDALIVAKSGGQYTSVQSAVNASVGTALQPQAIIIYPGVYLEKVNTVGKFVSLIGVDKKTCIIKTDTGNYLNPPLECAGGLYAQNLTFLATSENPDAHTLYSYAVHMDFYGEGKTEFFNCVFESQQNSALGIGLHQNQTLILNNCDIVKRSNGRIYDEGGALYFHNSPNPETNQKLIVKNSKIVSDRGFALRIDDARLNAGGTDTTTTVEFLNNNFLSETSGSGSNIYFASNTPINGGISGNIKLTVNSYYNNIQILNKTSIDVTSFRGVKFPAFQAGANEFNFFNDDAASGDFRLSRADGKTLMYYNNATRLGFRTLTPVAYNHFYGETLSAGSESTYAAMFSNGSNSGVILGYSSSNNTGYIGVISPGIAWRDLSLLSAGGDLMVGTDITNGVDKLQVNGSSVSTAWKTVGGTSSQYVKGDGSLSSTVPDSRPYKVYTALLSQSGTSAPTAIVLENTLGINITFTRSSTGFYLTNTDNLFNEQSKMVFFATPSTSNSGVGIGISKAVGVARIEMKTTDSVGSISDGAMSSPASIEIRVYNFMLLFFPYSMLKRRKRKIKQLN